MAMRSFLLINIEASVINFFTTGHDSSLLRRWTLAFGKMNDIFSHESVGLSWNWYLNLLLVLVDLLILLLKRLLKLHILVIHLMHLLLFTSKNRVLRGR
jgi:Na+-translocating ferredoxin:NAD+ oxidoreductase RnfD subunit